MLALMKFVVEERIYARANYGIHQVLLLQRDDYEEQQHFSRYRK